MQLRDARRAAPASAPSFQPAAVGGWNTRDDQAVIAPTDAQELENWFPESNYVRLRKGNQQHATGLAGIGRTLYSYIIGGNIKLLGFSGSTIYDCTTVGVATVLKTGFSSAIWSTVTMGAEGLFFNGADTPQRYDGTVVIDNVFTGVTDPTTLKYAHVHKERLFVWQEDSLTFYYGANQAVTGALSAFDLSFVRSLGGKIVAMGSLTYDSGEGVDDTLAIFLSCGEVLLYQGSDPGDATDWALEGVFRIGCILSPRSVQQFGGDVIVMTEQGFFPLSAAITGKNLSDAVTISDKINPSVEAAAKATTDRSLWRFALFTKENMLIANIPLGQAIGGIAQFSQYVMNTRTGAWCLFTGWNGGDWVVQAGTLYYIEETTAGTESTVYKAEVGASDYGNARMGRYFGAYTGLSAFAVNKKWNLARTVFTTEGVTNIAFGMAVDYEPFPQLASVDSADVAGAEWDNATWDEADWGGAFRQQIQWRNLGRLGYVGAIAHELKSSTQEVIRYYGATLVVEPARQPVS